MNQIVLSVDEMMELGKKLGRIAKGGDVIELVGDIGAGKTVLTKGIAVGMQIDDTVQSPTFTISRVYTAADGRRLAHYDFYRLTDAGIMANELDEAIDDPDTVVVIEWGDIVAGVLPQDVLTVRIASPSETSREVTFQANGERGQQMIGMVS